MQRDGTALERPLDEASLGDASLGEAPVGWIEVTRPNIPLRAMVSGIHEIAGFRSGSTQPTS